MIDVMKRNERIEQYLPLVGMALARVCRRLPASAQVERDDLRSEGVLGLIDAVSRYDEARADEFSGLAMVRIRGAMVDELRRRDVRSKSYRTRVKRIAAARAAGRVELGRELTDEEVRLRMGVDAELWDKWQVEAPVYLVELDAPQTDGYAPLVLVDETEGVREGIERREMSAVLARCIEELPAQQKRVLELLDEGMNAREVGEVIRRTESRVSQLRLAAVAKLRRLMSAAV